MLLSNLNLLATAPGGVARLRELILTLAVHGKLVAQDPNDEPASALLKKIRAEKNRLIADKVLKREKDEPALSGDSLPFDLPESWCWAAMGEVIDIVRGITFPATQKTREAATGRIACLRTTNVQQSIEWDDLLFVDRSFMGREDQLIQHHDIVMSMANSRELVGKVALIDQIPHVEATFGGFLGVLRPRKIDPRYAMAVLRTPYARTLLIDSSSQTTNIANVSLAKMRPLPFPLPPAAEQSRIVTRVEELMRLCDALEAKGQLEATQHAQLVSTLLGTLTESETPEELADNWQRVATHFDLLLDRPEAVDALEQTILQLAVRGLLVPQDPQDEPACELLKKIRVEKDKLIAEGKIKRDKPLPSIGEDERLFPLPQGWVWVRLRELVTHLGDGLHGTPNYSPSGDYFFVNGNNLGQGVVTIKPETKRVDRSEYEKYRKPLDATSVLLSINGTLGRVAFYQDEMIVLGKSACYFNVTAGLPKVFSKLLLECPDFMTYAEKSATGTTIKNLGLKAIGDWPIALPPLAEQSLIVTRVAHLRRLCNDLRQRLAAASERQSQLAQSLVEMQSTTTV